MTTANKVTITRILLVPLFVVEALYYVESGDEIYRFLAVLAFAIASLSDGLDGYIARRYNQRSELGAFLDPIADKLLLVSAVVLFSFKNDGRFDRIPLWLVATILSRDILLLVGFVLIQVICGRVHPEPHLTGKVATFFQILAVSWILLQWHDAWQPIWYAAAGLTTGVSGLLYLFDGIRQLNASPTSAPKPPA
jgi:cardiolipin synthase